MADSGVIARMLDTLLPYVRGRRLVAHGLEESAAGALREWADEKAGRAAFVVLGELPELDCAAGDLLLWMLPGEDTASAPEGFEVIETQHAFRIPFGLADDTAAPTLPPDPDWPYPRNTDGVWMDEARASKIEGCLVIARRTN